MQCEELFRLVEELPENEVSAVLDDVRRHAIASVRADLLSAGSGANEHLRPTPRGPGEACA